MVPFQEDSALLGGRQERQFGKSAIGLGDDSFQQCLKVAEHARDSVVLEQVGVVFQRGAESLRRLHQRQGQIELGGASVHLQRLQFQPRQPRRRGRRVLQHEHHLKKGIATQVPVGLQLFHQFFKRQILMRKGAQRILAHTGQKLPKSRIARKVAAENQCVNEESNQFLQLQLSASGNTRAHQNVLLAGVAVQQGLPGGQQRHEQRSPLRVA